MIFNIVADMLAVMIERAKVDGQTDGVVNHLVDGGLSILQYADDTILFMDHDLEKARNLKLILSAFEQLSGLKINFHKSEFEQLSPVCRTVRMWVGPVSDHIFGDADTLSETYKC